ncbi:putative minor extracellular protease vpr [Thozetella sp. PMI_491]|nr:putative minor extracellular protease vpr [Thozetella sp. PMI_491]
MRMAKGASLGDLLAQVRSVEGTTVTKIFDSPVFSGVSVDAADGDIHSLQSFTAAANVWPSRSVSLGVRDPLDSYAAAIGSPNYSVHGMTGADKLHATGLSGKGVQIALIGTGADYTHPALGGCFGPGCKIVGGYDFAGDGCWPLIGCRKSTDADPMDTNGRGTQAAGVLVGADDASGFSGVAPEATVYVYKVVASDPSTDDETLIEAFLKAYDDGADIISCAPISVSGYANDALSTVASRLVDEGVLVAIGVGESSNYGPYYSYTGTSGKKVLAVTSVQADVTPQSAFPAALHLNGASSNVRIGFNSWGSIPMPSTLVDFPIVPLTMNTAITDDACGQVSGDFSNSIPLVRLGGCDAILKQANLEAAGAQYMIFYPNSTVVQYEGLNFDGTAAYVISHTSGEGIVNAYIAGGTVTGDFSADPNTYKVAGPVTDGTGGTPDTAGNWGPLNDLSIKPDVAAPGSNIWAPTLNHDWYYTLYGSEVASAYIAGIAALYIERFGGRKTNPNFNATELAMRIMSSGSPLPYFDMRTYTLTSDIAPVAQVGCGMVNATNVLSYTTSLSFAKFELNDTHHFERYHKVDITNNADVDATYTFGVLPGVGLETWLTSADRIARQDELTPIDLQPDIHMPSGTFKLSPGETKTAEFDFTQPDYSGILPLYGGTVLINSSLGESLSVPYLGLAANLHDSFEAIFTTGYPYITSGMYNDRGSDGDSWSFDLSFSAQSFPKLNVMFRWGTDELRWDIFDSTYSESEWVYPPMVGQNKYVGSATYWHFSQFAYYYDPDAILIASNISAFPLTGVSRGYALSPFIHTNTPPDVRQWWWLGSLADGTVIPAGKYVMRVAALRPFGDRTRSSDWDVWTQSFAVSP